jgi:hypothetical protein
MRFIRPDKSFIGATVTGTVDATYEAAWACDARPNYPVRGTGLSLTATVGSALLVDLVAVCHHDIPAGTSVTGAGQAITIPTWRPDGIPYNAYSLITPTSTASVAFTVSGGPYHVGEFFAGASEETEREVRWGNEHDPGEPFTWETLRAPYDDGIADLRRLRGEVVCSDAGRRQIENWYASTRKGTLPSLILMPCDDILDPWLCTIRVRSRWRDRWWYVTLDVVEIPRIRWGL